MGVCGDAAPCRLSARLAPESSASSSDALAAAAAFAAGVGVEALGEDVEPPVDAARRESDVGGVSVSAAVSAEAAGAGVDVGVAAAAAQVLVVGLVAAR